MSDVAKATDTELECSDDVWQALLEIMTFSSTDDVRDFTIDEDEAANVSNMCLIGAYPLFCKFVQLCTIYFH